MKPTVTDTAIAGNLAALAEGLGSAASFVIQAMEAMKAGKRNLAVGTVLHLEQELPTYYGLLTATLAFHRKAEQGGSQ